MLSKGNKPLILCHCQMPYLTQIYVGPISLKEIIYTILQCG